MKKIFLFILISGSMLSVSAQVDTTTKTVTTTTSTHKYSYYPTSNVYFDQVTGNYWYRENSNAPWTMSQTLPTTITVDKTVEYPVTYSGNDPWKNNRGDIKKYKVKKNGVVKIKPANN